jgi:CPA2 family monovalent cation:H+ antiporter-2
VVEDLFTVVALVLLPALFGAGAGGWAHLPATLGITALKMGALVLLIFVVGGRVVPWLLEKVAATCSRELFTLTVLVLALGIAVGSAKVFGVSMALGAFLAGMVVGRSEFSQRAAAEALPMRDAFAVLFFVSVGMLLEPRALLESPGFLLATLGVVLIGKPLAAFLIVLVLKYPLRAALAVAVALAQIGEFSFILAALAKELGILDPSATNILVAAAIVSITLNPLLYRLVNPVERWLMKKPWLKRWFSGDTDHNAEAAKVMVEKHRAIVIGYGPVGRTVTRLLKENNIEPCVIEMNLDTVRELRAQGLAAIYGDAGMRDILISAQIEQADSLILSASSVQGSQEVVRMALELNPGIHVLARSNYVRELTELREAGAESVFSGEGEVALAMTETLLRELGATPDQIDSERERVRMELQVRA